LTPPGILTQIRRIAAKDLVIEWRSREIIATSAFLAAVVVLVFSFAFVVGGTPPAHRGGCAGGVGRLRSGRGT